MYRVNMRFYFSKEFKDDFGNKAGIEEVKISSYKGAARKPAFRLVCSAEYNNGFIYHISVHETMEAALKTLEVFSCGTFKEV